MNGNYQEINETDRDDEQYSDDEEKTLLERFLTCLKTYTIGSCHYSPFDGETRRFRDAIRKDEKDIELLRKSNGSVNGALREDQESEWKGKTSRADNEMKTKLRYHFKSHIEKWKDETRRRFPWKLTLHILLILLVTAQISIYAIEKFKVTMFLTENTVAFTEHFVIPECDKPKDTLYTMTEVYDQIEHVVESFYYVSREPVSSFFYFTNESKSKYADYLRMTVDYKELQDCFDQKVHYYPYNDKYTVITRDLFLPTTNITEEEPCNITKPCCTLEYCNYTVMNQVVHFINRNNIDRVQKIQFEFILATVYYKGVIDDYSAIDAKYTVKVIMNNQLQSSNVHVHVELYPELWRYCTSTIRTSTILDVIVIILLVITGMIYFYSIFNTVKLSTDVALHFKAYHGKRLRWSELSVLFNKWYILAFIACVVLVTATIIKILTDYKRYISFPLIEADSILLACGVFMLWCGLFGFLKYFETLNVMLITIKLAFPSVMRFAVCVLILFVSFVLCGWLVLGPYSLRFRDPITTSESLIAFLNGDGLSSAFSAVSVGTATVSISVAIFNKIYILIFVFIFIYVVVSLFIGIFAQAYNSLSDNWKERSRGYVWDWADEEEQQQMEDLTKSYPFPYPRIRNSCSASSESIKSSIKHDETSIILSNADKFDTNTNSNPVNGSIPVPVKPNAQMQYLTTFQVNHDDGHGLNVPDVRHYSTTVKSIAAEPPNASKKEIARARSRLLSKVAVNNVSNTLEESDV
ncbi:mucolipin-3-like isoform X2 [Dysidea avara]|uniref:mucolipin-3-like isoform X2 n=1 Tax=Dysidea avara TaxID=196820 RepID=UPI0033272BD5